LRDMQFFRGGTKVSLGYDLEKSADDFSIHALLPLNLNMLMQ